MKFSKVNIAYLLFFASLSGTAQTKVVAHRGYWKSANSAQNSITALKKAAEAKVYGSEFDVQLTKDKEVVVAHDDVIDGFEIFETPLAELRNLKLKNGEVLPTLDEYLEVGKSLEGMKLILEIKPLKTKEAEDEAVSIIVDKVRKMQMENQVEYISFSINICEQLAKATPASEIAYLNGDISPKELKEKGINGIDYNHKVLSKHPEWIQEAQQLGMKVNVWTVNNMEVAQKMIDLKVDYITTDHPKQTQELIRKI